MDNQLEKNIADEMEASVTLGLLIGIYSGMEKNMETIEGLEAQDC